MGSGFQPCTCGIILFFKPSLWEPSHSCCSYLRGFKKQHNTSVLAIPLLLISPTHSSLPLSGVSRISDSHSIPLFQHLVSRVCCHTLFHLMWRSQTCLWAVWMTAVKLASGNKYSEFWRRDITSVRCHRRSFVDSHFLFRDLLFQGEKFNFKKKKKIETLPIT